MTTTENTNNPGIIAIRELLTQALEEKKASDQKVVARQKELDQLIADLQLLKEKVTAVQPDTAMLEKYTRWLEANDGQTNVQPPVMRILPISDRLNGGLFSSADRRTLDIATCVIGFIVLFLIVWIAMGFFEKPQANGRDMMPLQPQPVIEYVPPVYEVIDLTPAAIDKEIEPAPVYPSIDSIFQWFQVTGLQLEPVVELQPEQAAEVQQVPTAEPQTEPVVVRPANVQTRQRLFQRLQR